MLELEQELGSLDYLVVLVVGGVLHDNSVVEIQIVVKAEDVHSSVVDQATLVGLNVVVLLVLNVVDVLLDVEVAAGVRLLALDRDRLDALAIVDDVARVLLDFVLHVRHF